MNFETRMKEFEKDLDKLGKILQEVYPIDVSKTFEPQQRMAMQLLAMFAGLKAALSDLNTRLVVLESK